jgi:hypothetical protein
LNEKDRKDEVTKVNEEEISIEEEVIMRPSSQLSSSLPLSFLSLNPPPYYFSPSFLSLTTIHPPH